MRASSTGSSATGPRKSHESDEEFFDSIIDLCWSEATDIGLPLKDYLNQYFLYKGDTKLNIRGLYPGSWYYAIAVGMDDGGNRTTSFVTEKFQAAPIEMNGATFTMSWTETGRR